MCVCVCMCVSMYDAEKLSYMGRAAHPPSEIVRYEVAPPKPMKPKPPPPSLGPGSEQLHERPVDAKQVGVDLPGVMRDRVEPLRNPSVHESSVGSSLALAVALTPPRCSLVLWSSTSMEPSHVATCQVRFCSCTCSVGLHA